MNIGAEPYETYSQLSGEILEEFWFYHFLKKRKISRPIVCTFPLRCSGWAWCSILTFQNTKDTNESFELRNLIYHWGNYLPFNKYRQYKWVKFIMLYNCVEFALISFIESFWTFLAYSTHHFEYRKRNLFQWTFFSKHLQLVVFVFSWRI